MKRTFRVLSIDGGGIRGIIPARIVAELELRSGRPASEMFDLIVGTSTGGILAVLLTTPDGDGSPRHEAAHLVEMYAEQSYVIFPHLSWSRDGRQAEVRRYHGSNLSILLHRAAAMFGPGRYGNSRYPATGIEAMLEQMTAGTRLSEATTDLLVTSYDMRTGRPYLFKSWETHGDGALDLPMATVARATSAAPTYLPPLRVDLPDGRHMILIDGGVVMNSPAQLGLAEAYHRQFETGEDSNIMVVSIGTGHPPESVPTYDDIWRKSFFKTAMHMIPIILDGTTEIGDELVRELVLREESQRYWRLQAELRGASLAIDDASPRQIAALLRNAEDLIEQASDSLDDIVTSTARPSTRLDEEASP